MKKESIDKAISDAKRFIEKASELKLVVFDHSHNDINGYPKEQGAVMRASMDWTRALADMRQGR